MLALLTGFLLAIGGATQADLPSIEDPDRSPLWELGLGGGATFQPDYPGSDQSRWWAIPFPWGIYRGDILHSDRRGGTRARFLRGARFELNGSAAGGLPSSSAHNTARMGMPDLEYMGQVGPRLSWDLLAPESSQILRFGLPLRAVFTANSQHLRDQGFTVAPELLYDDPDFFGHGFDAFALFTVNFVDRRFANYFYGVPPDYATGQRPAYVARAGYLLTDLSFGVLLPVHWSQVRIYAFTTLQSQHGSINEDSPLMRTSLNASYSAVLIWAFAQSKTKVRNED